jgi:hypothetical protein
MGLSNQGRELDGVLGVLSIEELLQTADVVWKEVHEHPEGASCACPVLETLAFLYELGYRVVKEPTSTP